MAPGDNKRKLTAILRSDVIGHSRLMDDDEGAAATFRGNDLAAPLLRFLRGAQGIQAADVAVYAAASVVQRA